MGLFVDGSQSVDPEQRKDIYQAREKKLYGRYNHNLHLKIKCGYMQPQVGEPADKCEILWIPEPD